MSRISEYRHIEQQIAQHQRLLEVLKGDPGLETEIESETKLKDLLAKLEVVALPKLKG